MPYFDILFGILGVAFFARGARIEGESPVLWGALSAGAWCLSFLSGGGLLPWAGGQLVVYGLMFARKLVKERKREKDGV